VRNVVAFLSLIIFTFPGLVAYFWIQLFGFTPTIRYQGVEILAISATLWIPINTTVLLIYNTFSLIYKYNIYYPIEFLPINNFEDLSNLSTNFIFILYYTVMSVFVGYFLAKFISGKFYDFMLEKINKIRVANNKTPLSRDASVWDTVFSKHEAQVVKVIKIGSEEKFDIGEIKNVSRTYETEKNIVLRQMELWRKIDGKYNLDVKEVFIDVKSGIKIIVYDSEQCQLTLNDYRRQESEKSSNAKSN